MVAELLDIVHLMAREDHYLAPGNLISDNLLERLSIDRIQPGKRLIQDDDVRIVHQGSD